MKNSEADLYQIGVKELIGDVTTGLARPLSTEIVFAPFSAVRKAFIASKPCKIDGKCQR
jgi:hypothetical protein